VKGVVFWGGKTISEEKANQRKSKAIQSKSKTKRMGKVFRVVVWSGFTHPLYKLYPSFGLGAMGQKLIAGDKDSGLMALRRQKGW
jgi:hypothetical protein